MATVNLYCFSSNEYHQPSGLTYYLYRFYEPNMQRWINREPIEESGGINLYAFALNNPANEVDFLGLNEQDVQLILSGYHQAITEMNNEGHRVGWFPPLSSLNSDLYPWPSTGNGWECVRQAEYVSKKLNQQQYQDKWKIFTVTRRNLTHTWVVAISNDPNDPIIKLDPWKGYTDAYHKAPMNINVNSLPNIVITR